MVLVGEPNLNKCAIKGDNLSIKGPTKNLYILNTEVVLMTVLGSVFPNQSEYYGLPLTSCVIFGQSRIPSELNLLPAVFQQLLEFYAL